MKSRPKHTPARITSAAPMASSRPAPKRRVLGRVASTQDVANAVLFRALSLVGTPYRGGGNRPDTGFDCSGLVGYVFADAAGMALPRTTRALADIDAPSVPRARLSAGDLVLFAISGHTVSHVGIYVGDGRFVHAPSRGGTVRMDALDADYWRKRFVGGRRVAL